VKPTTSIAKTIALVCLVMLLLPPAALAWQKKGLRLRGRAQMRYTIEDQIQSGDGLPTTDWVNYFLLRRARIDGRWKPADWIRLMLELEFADRARPRDVYVRMDLHPLLRITAGQFKKPFSRLKMESPFNLVVPERGMLNRFAVADTYYGGFGGRDVGLMLSGTWDGPVRLRYYLGAFNNLLDDDSFHRDYVARLQVRVIKGLILAVNASHKYYDEESDSGVVPRTKNMFGADIRWTLGDFRLDVEGAFGDNANTDEQQQDGDPVLEVVNAYGSMLYGAHATVSYRLKINESLVLTPAFMVEVFDPSDNQGTDAVVRLAGAVNADIGKNVRVALSAEGLLDQSIEYDSPTNIFVQLGVGF
jgi:hypothetical protein